MTIADPIASEGPKIKNNPFIGLTAEQARKKCGEIMRAFCKELPTRPALPAETEESGASRIYTDHAVALFEKVRTSAEQALQEAGFDPVETYSNPGFMEV